ncbi:hypothetical protein O4160_13275 [Rhodococcus sp. IEGM 1401]|jgi:hypothetical protein|uniref:hypothetical protein n=1 Tax=unclassified Rhodococcus (in: high G+C Gram-positive bacteria) TaxID=192944 RepID=UPI0022B4547E|nr:MULTISPECIES: hypothetical protein [unclassified Rhodococcus (in: high G+C Gram-positive bacteria)]MCZ4561808.1 hypothetical protein [Rhodococcus sp. IEGM 1401]MDI9922015.1 hypothetical protein [Rhodococcus sp. IEGM 1372]MDV8034402.1 hypothetical protein [Rhodococcus sp. IEGM 1414]
MIERVTDAEYQLRWPRALFVQEAAKLLNLRASEDNWDDRCKLLLRDAFVDFPACGPLDDLNELPGTLGLEWVNKPKDNVFSYRQSFLRDLMSQADQLNEDPSARRPLWRERHGITTSAESPAAFDTLVTRYVDLANDLDTLCYFDRIFTKDCVDDQRGHQPEQYLYQNLTVDLAWPLDSSVLIGDRDLFYDVVEVLHDAAARPRDGWEHNYNECGWHGKQFDSTSGRAVYRWRVNKLFDRHDVRLRLAEDGAEEGRLVTTTDDARNDLIDTATSRTTPSVDRVQHGVEQFRKRGATRNDKRSAARSLADVLESRRKNVLADALNKTHAGQLFLIANKFDIRHHAEDQNSDYPDYYLDWIFWLYLATIELTNNILEEQRAENPT